jgi:hypothetical protein
VFLIGIEGAAERQLAVYSVEKLLFGAEAIFQFYGNEA